MAASPTAPHSDGVIRGRPPHSPKAKRTVVFERRYTIPDVPSNSDLYSELIGKQIGNFHGTVTI